MTILSDVLAGDTGQAVKDWLSLSSVKLGLAALLFGGGAVIILTHRHRHDMSRAFGALQKSVPLAAFMV